MAPTDGDDGEMREHMSFFLPHLKIRHKIVIAFGYNKMSSAGTKKKLNMSLWRMAAAGARGVFN